MKPVELGHEDQVTVLALHRVSKEYNRLPWQLFNSLWEQHRTEMKIHLRLDEIGFELERQSLSDDLSYSVTIQKDDWNELLQMSSDDSTEESLSMALVSHFELLENEVISRKTKIVKKIKETRRHILLNPHEFTTGYEYQEKYLSEYPECVADAFIHGEFKTSDEDLKTVDEIINHIAPTLESAHQFCRILDKMVVPVASRSWIEITSKPPEPRMLVSSGWLPALAVHRCILLLDRTIAAYEAEDFGIPGMDDPPDIEFFRGLLSRMLHIKARLVSVELGGQFFAEKGKTPAEIAVQACESALTLIGQSTPENQELRNRIRVDMMISEERLLGNEMSTYSDPENLKGIIFERLLKKHLHSTSTGDLSIELPLDRSPTPPPIVETLMSLPYPDLEDLHEFEEAVENSKSLEDEDKVVLLDSARTIVERHNQNISQKATFKAEWQRMINDTGGDSRFRMQLHLNLFLFHHEPSDRIDFLSYKLKEEPNDPYSKALIHLLRGIALTEIEATNPDDEREALERAVEDLQLAAELMQGYLPVRRETAINYLNIASRKLMDDHYPSPAGSNPTEFLVNSPIPNRCKAFLLSEIFIPTFTNQVLADQQRCRGCSRIHVEFSERESSLSESAYTLLQLHELMQVSVPEFELELEELLNSLRISLISTPGFNKSLIPPIPDDRLSSEGTDERFLQDGINSTITGDFDSFKGKYPSGMGTLGVDPRPVESLIWEIVYPETIIPLYDEMRGDPESEFERARALERHSKQMSGQDEQYLRIISEIEDSYLAIAESEKEGSNFDEAQIRLGSHLCNQVLRSDAGLSVEEIEALRERGSAYFDEVPVTSDQYLWARNCLGHFKFQAAIGEPPADRLEGTPDDDLEGLEDALLIFSSFTPDMEQDHDADDADEEQDQISLIEIGKRLHSLIGSSHLDGKGGLIPKLPFYYSQALSNKITTALRISKHVDEARYSAIISDVAEDRKQFSTVDSRWPSANSIYAQHLWYRARIEKSVERREQLVDEAYELMLATERHSHYSHQLSRFGIAIHQTEYKNASHLISSMRHYKFERDIIEGADLSMEELTSTLAGFQFSINERNLGKDMIAPIVDALFAIVRLEEFIEGLSEEGESGLSDHEIELLRGMLGSDVKLYEALISIYDWSDEDRVELRACIQLEKSRCENFGLEHLNPTLDQLHERVLGLPDLWDEIQPGN